LSKKQIRISDPALIQKRIGEFVKKSITVVFNDSRTVFGLLMAVDGNTISLQNRRLKKITFPLADISEIFTDIEG
jgi:hypothetical protein